MTRPVPRNLLPDTAAVGEDGWLTVGGCSLGDLAGEYGTPLFVYDEAHLRARCREAVTAFPDGVAYATKAFLCRAMAKLALEEGMRLDVATHGELHVAIAAGATGDQLVLHGNNKSVDELRLARRIGATIVVDSFDELDRLDALHAEDRVSPRALVRITPGVEAHTHEFIRTGQFDSKFGFGVASGDAAKAIERATQAASIAFDGLHLHIGSQVFVADFFHQAVDVVAPFVKEVDLGELSIGGGLGVAYVDGEEAPTISQWARSVRDACASAGITSRVTAEPGRAIVAASAVTLYTIGTVKDLPDIRTYVSVDGGMSDNPRPVLYGSGYEAFLPRAPFADRPRSVRIVGKHCESGDVLVREAWVPSDLAVGDVLATPVTGAYGHSMGSNYNKVLRPAVVFARDGDARQVVRREVLDDLLTTDLG
jgi:diaminopimelate decarboxylase